MGHGKKGHPLVAVATACGVFLCAFFVIWLLGKIVELFIGDGKYVPPLVLLLVVERVAVMCAREEVGGERVCRSTRAWHHTATTRECRERSLFHPYPIP
jgi:hypothetical protein